ncbi:MAG TPA: FAD binding domain-containing protein [Vicinamibacterales bacterium]|nr:FAD binding domain-containing protein [Vicinamibacterales bacterium]
MSTAPALPRIELTVNGEHVAVESAASHVTLLDFLRARGLTGAKEGCAEGECGACTVVMVADEGGRAAYRAVNSCLVLLPTAAHHELYTVESLASSGALADVQKAMAAGGGSQCGYCTPGFVMSLFAEHYRPDRTGPCDPHAMAGNLCRCTGYRPIRDAALALGPAPADAFHDRLHRPAPVLESITSDSYSRPTTIAACVEILASHPQATLIAGGSDLGVESNLRSRRFAHLVSVDAIDELHEFSATETRVRIGAAMPLTDIARLWHDAPPAFSEWITLFASPPIRNRATLGGNLATASPIGDAAPLLMALDAHVVIAGPNGRRALDLASFFTGYRKTVLRSGELITAIEIPRPWPRQVSFYKVSKRRLDDISTVAAAFSMEWDGAGRVRRARFAFGGVAATPLRLRDVEDAVSGQAWNESAVERAQRVIGRTLTPLSDVRGSKEYRLDVAKCLVEKFYWETRS